MPRIRRSKGWDALALAAAFSGAACSGQYGEATPLEIVDSPAKAPANGAIRTVAEVNTPSGDEYPSWISPDGCRLYVMTFNANGGNPSARLRVATLAP